MKNRIFFFCENGCQICPKPSIKIILNLTCLNHFHMRVFYFYFFRHKLNNYGFEWWLAVFFSNPVIGGLHGPNNKLKLFGIYQSSVHIMGNLIVDWLLFEHLSYLFIKKKGKIIKIRMASLNLFLVGKNWKERKRN